MRIVDKLIDYITNRVLDRVTERSPGRRVYRSDTPRIGAEALAEIFGLEP